MEMIFMNLYVVAKSEIAKPAAEYINNIAQSNAFATPMNNDELGQYRRWFERQIESCDLHIAENLAIELEEFEIED